MSAPLGARPQHPVKGIALLFVGWGAYGPQDKISEAQVDAEMRKMQGDG